MTGTIFNIQKFCVNDGPGIRTTVFFKGCPLDCLWCHNPESKSARAQVLFDTDKCLLCGGCVTVCPDSRHRLENAAHLFEREGCAGCGQCTERCLSGALSLAGRRVGVQEVMTEVLRDRDFYCNGGGLTLSGGEPLAQPEFALALLRAAKAEGLHTCIETCGFAKWETVDAVRPFVDLFLYDYKLTDPEEHRRCTGVSNRRILENLRLLNENGASVILRCPIIPGINDTPQHFSGIASLAEELDCIKAIDVEPYHPLGSSKAALLGRDYALKGLTFPAEEEVQNWLTAIASQTHVPVRKA
ncbi:MAG: glycyl-radical enzyme activating protein [Clostridia bacterium]|nr:glycyl-radical enzyme activating protein [Clostridia bacterium]